MRNHIEETYPLVQQARRKSLQLVEERDIMARRISKLQRKLEESAAQQIIVKRVNDKNSAIDDAAGGAQGDWRCS